MFLDCFGTFSLAVSKWMKTKALGEPTWGDLLRGRVGFLLLIGISLQLLQQLVGMNAFMYFGPRVFQDLGFDPTRFQTMSNLVNFLSTFPALLFADKYGRCRLLWWSALGMFLACMTIATISEKILVVSGEGLYTTYASTSTSGSYVIVAMVFFFVMNFAYGWGPIVWVYNSEIFPLRCRSRCVATSTCANWIGNYLIAQCTPILLGKIGFLTFYIFGSFSLLALLLAGWLPETKGVVLEQMDRVFDEKLGVVKPKAAGSYEEALLADQLEGAWHRWSEVLEMGCDCTVQPLLRQRGTGAGGTFANSHHLECVENPVFLVTSQWCDLQGSVQFSEVSKHFVDVNVINVVRSTIGVLSVLLHFWHAKQCPALTKRKAKVDTFVPVGLCSLNVFLSSDTLAVLAVGD